MQMNTFVDLVSSSRAENPLSFDSRTMSLASLQEMRPKLVKAMQSPEISKFFKKNTQVIIFDKESGKSYCIFRTGNMMDNCTESTKLQTTDFIVTLPNDRAVSVVANYKQREAAFQAGKLLFGVSSTIDQLIEKLAIKLQVTKDILVEKKNGELNEFVDFCLDGLRQTDKFDEKNDGSFLKLLGETTASDDESLASLFDSDKRKNRITVGGGIIACGGRSHLLGLDIKLWNEVRFEWMVKVILDWCEQMEIDPASFANYSGVYFELDGDEVVIKTGSIHIDRFLEKQISTSFLNEWMFTSVKEGETLDGGKNLLGLIWDMIITVAKILGRAPTFYEFAAMFPCNLQFDKI